MNIEIANRLVNLRKQKGFSQEELAEKLGLSRQAVSKWERAEASPDTDNLICLAKLYGVSLDELLKTDQSINDIVEEKPVEEKKPEENGKKKTSVHIGVGGIHVVDENGEEVHIGPTGIHVTDGGEKVDIGPGGIHINEKKPLKGIKFREVVSAIYAPLVVIAYLMLGFLIPGGGWHPWWILFLTIPLVPSLIDCFIYKRITKFAYPVLVTVVYLFLGFMLPGGGWHPWWVIFLTIPVFYLIFRPIEKLWLKDSDKDIIIDAESDEDDDDKDDDDDEDDEKKDKEINITIETEEKKNS